MTCAKKYKSNGKCYLQILHLFLFFHRQSIVNPFLMKIINHACYVPRAKMVIPLLTVPRRSSIWLPGQKNIEAKKIKTIFCVCTYRKRLSPHFIYKAKINHSPSTNASHDKHTHTPKAGYIGAERSNTIPNITRAIGDLHREHATAKR